MLVVMVMLVVMLAATFHGDFENLVSQGPRCGSIGGIISVYGTVPLFTGT